MRHFFVLVLALVFAGCGGDDGNPDPKNTPLSIGQKQILAELLHSAEVEQAVVYSFIDSEISNAAPELVDDPRSQPLYDLLANCEALQSSDDDQNEIQTLTTLAGDNCPVNVSSLDIYDNGDETNYSNQSVMKFEVKDQAWMDLAEIKSLDMVSYDKGSQVERDGGRIDNTSSGQVRGTIVTKQYGKIKISIDGSYTDNMSASTGLRGAGNVKFLLEFSNFAVNLVMSYSYTPSALNASVKLNGQNADPEELCLLGITFLCEEESGSSGDDSNNGSGLKLKLANGFKIH